MAVVALYARFTKDGTMLTTMACCLLFLYIYFLTKLAIISVIHRSLVATG